MLLLAALSAFCLYPKIDFDGVKPLFYRADLLGWYFPYRIRATKVANEASGEDVGNSAKAGQRKKETDGKGPITVSENLIKASLGRLFYWN